MLIPGAVLRTRITVEPWSGNTGDGESYGAAVAARGGLDRTRRVVRTPKGKSLAVAATLLVRPDVAVHLNDRVKAGSDSWLVAQVTPAEVGGRVHHQVVLLV